MKNIKILSLLIYVISFMNCGNRDVNIIYQSWGIDLKNNQNVEEYQELFFSEEYIYIFKEAGLTQIVDFKVSNDTIVFLDRGKNVIGKSRFEIDENKKLIIFNSEKKDDHVSYLKISKGITPKDYVVNNEKEQYWMYFSKRKENSTPW